MEFSKLLLERLAKLCLFIITLGLRKSQSEHYYENYSNDLIIFTMHTNVKSPWINRLRNFSINFILVCLSTTFSLVIVEIFIRYTNLNIPEKVDCFAMNGMTLPSYPEFVRFVPNTESIAISSTAEFQNHYKINSKGLRDEENYKYKQHNGLRCLFIGDSLTEGFGVEHEESFTELIEKDSNHSIECINAGIRGTSPSDFYFRIPKLIKTFKDINLIFLQLFDNDVWDDMRYTQILQLKIKNDSIERLPFHQSHSYLKHLRSFAKPLSHIRLSWIIGSFFIKIPGMESKELHYECSLAEEIEKIYQHSSIKLKINPINDANVRIEFPYISENILSEKSLDQLWNLFKGKKYNNFDRVNPSQEILFHPNASKQDYEKSLQYILLSNKLCQKNKIPMVLVYIPSLDGLRYNTGYYLSSWSSENNIPFISLTKPLQKAARESNHAIYYPIDGHFTELGHQIASQEILNWINTMNPGE